MSIQQEHKSHCSSCGHEQQITLWQSINVSINPELKEKLFNGEINTYTCTNCNQKVFISSPLLYHDMQRAFCIQYYPVNSLEDPEFLKQFDEEGRLSFEGVPAEVVENAGYMTEPHIVFDVDELLRYIVFRDQLHKLQYEQDQAE